MVNRTQALVLGFFLLAVTSLLVILTAAPEVYDQALRLPTGSRAVEIAFLAVLLGFIALLGVGCKLDVANWKNLASTRLILARGHEAVCVSHQLPVETLRRAMIGQPLRIARSRTLTIFSP